MLAMELEDIERDKFEAKRQIRQFFFPSINYAIWYTIGVVHSTDIKFGDLVTNKDRKTISFVDWPGIVIRYSHSIVLAVTLAWRFKKNHQTTKLKSPSNVPLIRYDKHVYITTQHTGQLV